MMSFSRLSQTMILLLLLGGNPAVGAEALPYQTNLSTEWKLKNKVEDLQIWFHSNQPSTFISATSHELQSDMKSSEMWKLADETSVTAPLKQSDLENFEKERAPRMQDAGIRDWKISQASRKRIGTSHMAVQFEGTYVGPSGAHFCFSERQMKAQNKLLQLTATAKKGDACDWVQLSSWLDQIQPK